VGRDGRRGKGAEADESSTRAAKGKKELAPALFEEEKPFTLTIVTRLNPACTA